MKTDFSINVQVNLGVTPEIVALVNAILCHRPTVAPTADFNSIKVRLKPVNLE